MKFAFLLWMFIFSTSARAAVKTFEIDSDTVSAIDTSDEAKTKIFGGAVSSTKSPCSNSSSVCDSCAALASIGTYTQCNSRSISSGLNLTFRMVFDSIPSTSFKVLLGSTELSTSSYTLTPSSPVANQTVTVAISWGAICSQLGSNSTCGTEAINTNADLKMGFAASSGSDLDSANSKTVALYLRIPKASLSSNTTGYHTNQCGAGVTGATGEGFCSFTVNPGDEKVYILNLNRASTIPEDGSSVRYSGLRVYFTTGAHNSITPASSYKDLLVSDKSTVSTSLLDSKVTGLSNEVTYRFLIASIDEAQNVTYFSNPALLNDTNHSATPGEVVGALNGQKCFVATAAFGSEMDPKVELLRKFRSDYLLKTDFGKNFVVWYYKNSPPAAEFISQSESLRILVRLALWPIVFLLELFYAGYLAHFVGLSILLVFLSFSRRARSASK